MSQQRHATPHAARQNQVLRGAPDCQEEVAAKLFPFLSQQELGVAEASCPERFANPGTGGAVYPEASFVLCPL